MQKRGFYILIVLLILIGFFIGRETKLTGLQINALGNITVNIASAVACTLSDPALNISFGTSLSAGTTYNATRNFIGLDNSTAYNITNDATSTTVINISIRGANFISDTNLVGISNVSWASNTTLGNGTNMIHPGTANLSTDLDTTNLLAVQEPIGSTAWYRLWIRIPGGTSAGTYTGNYTIRCEES